MVSAAAVWDALADVPDPEIPVVSLVDLGVVHDVDVTGDRVRVRLLPTFLGCPALEVMRSQAAEAVRALGAEPEVEVVLDEDWSTDRITRVRPAEAPRVRLRTARAPRERAPDPRPARAPRLPLSLLRLDGHAAREHLRADPLPLDPLLRACRQPFEQFKTI